MSAIVGYIGENNAYPFIINGLSNLEFRGYDSVGIATLQNEITLHKLAGTVSEFQNTFDKQSFSGSAGIGHLRYATCGEPADQNAHPHLSSDKKVAVVHNGTLKRFDEIKSKFFANKNTLKTPVDSEIIPHLIEELYTGDVLDAVCAATKELSSDFAIAVLHADHPNTIVCARKNAPLFVGKNEKGVAVASDKHALHEMKENIFEVPNNGFVLLEKNSIKAFDESEKELPLKQLSYDEMPAVAEGFDDFMLKEMNEQPQVLRRIIDTHIKDGAFVFDTIALSKETLASFDRVYMIACGSSYHASLVTKYLIERWVQIPVEVEVASEFNYRDVYVSDNTLCIIVTQSGETADTLLSAKKLRTLGAKVIACTNVLGSTAATKSDGVIFTQAGSEVSVAATKSYTAQILSLMLLALYLANVKGTLKKDAFAEIIEEIQKLPTLVETVLGRMNEAEAASVVCKDRPSALFLGRGVNMPTAREGALKLKEISYLHAEAYPTGEIKHGPIALVEDGFPLVVIAPNDDLRKKTLPQLHDFKEEGASVVCVATDGDKEIEEIVDYVLWIPETKDFLTPIVSVVQLQMFAHAIALARGRNVDEPRNLSKCVDEE